MSLHINISIGKGVRATLAVPTKWHQTDIIIIIIIIMP